MALTSRGEGWIPPSMFGRPSRAEREQAEAQLEADLAETVRTISEHVREEPGSVKGQLLADLLVGLVGDDVPPDVAAAAKSRKDLDAPLPECATFFAIGAGLWRHLLTAGVMTASRGAAIASRIAPCCDEPALLLLFQREAETHGMKDAARAFSDALDAGFPGFRRVAGRLRIGRALLERIGIDDSTRGVDARFYPDGHLARLSVPGSDGPALELERTPGAGRFTQTGKRGEYGFHTDERYEDGAVLTTFFSPWHDGSESRTPTDWVCWVLECAASVREAAARRKAPARSMRRQKR